ncbi:putative 2,4-dichlorophenol 6-monooxygenase [Talaromyces proteolyticus]|uniref:2,4-dichlorophenol 6-monooxygenase n=1 Tax=Talaromyces proteolyticus TaxID=1131652 RepID=A0AAD4L0U3_9EURO|nr:putative 2,4-dichlorophenol 6-monooxygenase [Talaromyces proteolyticus]KAH8703576.1 putative 2,4-dichlorophenol 6-monooxygenase [Talaromyces proteolyticus]
MAVNLGLDFDVVVVGGGPVGLLVAYQMARFGVSVCVLEKQDKETQDTFGRAIALFPRTMEQLDQLDLANAMLQLGFACRSSVTYKDGVEQVPGRVWTFMENIKGTVFDFALVLRQRYTEAIFREKLKSVGAVYFASTECTGFEVNDAASLDEYGVKSYWVNTKTQEKMTLKSKYLVGADGGRSFVRRHAEIPFDGDTSEDKWIRVDGIIDTDMPINRAYGAIESKTHGNVLWAPLDHGATRIGYAYTSEIAARYPDGVTEEVVVKEAIESMSPFQVKFREVHWWTLYTIGQRMARHFSTRNRIFLCGDAAHTHSSGAAQGLNTGIHDAVNLGWKLALQVRGFTKSEVLETYGLERKTAVEKLIDYDKDISLLMTHKWPSWYTGDKAADPYLVLGKIFEETTSFNTGLGISYSTNVLNQTPSVDISVTAGSRASDVELTVPGINQKTRLHRVARNQGKFWVVVFAGKVESTSSALQALRSFLYANNRLYLHPAIGWITVSASLGCSPYEAIGMVPFGDMYYDPAQEAHAEFGIDTAEGGVVIIRPDGLVGSGCGIDGAAISKYFSTILKFTI